MDKRPNNKRTAWQCKIGTPEGVEVPRGGDGPMREAVAKAFKELTGAEAVACFSGWGAEFTQAELHVIDPRMFPPPAPPPEAVKGGAAPNFDAYWAKRVEWHHLPVNLRDYARQVWDAALAAPTQAEDEVLEYAKTHDALFAAIEAGIEAVDSAEAGIQTLAAGAAGAIMSAYPKLVLRPLAPTQAEAVKADPVAMDPEALADFLDERSISLNCGILGDKAKEIRKLRHAALPTGAEIEKTLHEEVVAETKSANPTHEEADGFIRTMIVFLRVEAELVGLEKNKRSWLWMAEDYAKRRGWRGRPNGDFVAVVEARGDAALLTVTDGEGLVLETEIDPDKGARLAAAINHPTGASPRDLEADLRTVHAALGDNMDAIRAWRRIKDEARKLQDENRALRDLGKEVKP